jgi:murein DD-endopeptidase MepM/ murein hydrolase activator NlpD
MSGRGSIVFKQRLARASRAARVAVSAATLIVAAGAVGAAVTFDAHKAQAQEDATIQLVSFADPVPGHEVNSPFGLRKLPWEKAGRLHAGVDIAAANGTPVVVTTDGVVMKTGVSSSYGRYVEVAHGSGLTSFYGHLSSTLPDVAPGTPVGEGEKIAMIGSTGHSTGPHLHFEIRKDGKPLNPSVFMDRSFRPDALPYAEASKISPIVRIAHVSKWAAGKFSGES